MSDNDDEIAVAPRDDEVVSSHKPKNWCEKCQCEAYFNHVHCPNCDSPPRDHEVRNYHMGFHDGDVHCTRCGAYVRMWDAG